MKDTKQRIVRTAREIFLREGMDGLSMRRISAALGISATALYRHFADKDELLRELVDVSRERFMSYLADTSRRSEDPSQDVPEDPVERLREMGRRYVDFGLDNGSEYAVMFMSWNTLDAEVHSSEVRSAGGKDMGGRGGSGPEATVSRPLRMLLELVGACVGGKDESRIMELAVFFWSHLHGLVSLYLTGGGGRFLPREEYRRYCYRQADLSLKIIDPSV